MTESTLPAGRQDSPPVHEKTKAGPDWRYGCSNHATRKGNVYYAPNRIYLPNGKFYLELKEIETEWIEYESCPAKHDHQGCIDCIHNAVPQQDCGGAQHHRYSGSFSE